MSVKYKAFTLVELLVVIAIIGLLAAIASVSVSSVRAKGRDARRIADLKQLYKAIMVYSGDAIGTTFSDCNIGSVIQNCTKPADPAPALSFDFKTYKDPSGGVACSPLSVNPCQYAMRKAPKVDDYEICFFMESSNNPLGNRGPYNMISDGSMTPGCSNPPQ